MGIDDDPSLCPPLHEGIADEFILPNRFGTGQLDRAVQRFCERYIAMTAATSSETMGCIKADGSRTVSPSVADWAIPLTNSKNCVARDDGVGDQVDIGTDSG